MAEPPTPPPVPDTPPPVLWPPPLLPMPPVNSAPAWGIRRGLPRPVWIILAVAALWGAGLVVAALTVRTGAVTEVGSTNGVTFTRTLPGTTLVGENGPRALIVVSVPLVMVLVVWAVLMWRRHRRGGPRPGAGPVAWTCAGITVALSVAGMLTIGPFLLPVGGLLCVACALESTP